MKNHVIWQESEKHGLRFRRPLVRYRVRNCVDRDIALVQQVLWRGYRVRNCVDCVVQPYIYHFNFLKRSDRLH